MKHEKQYPLGLALSGGGAKGFAHLGVMQALKERNIYPDLISGTSAGALAGVFFADGHSPLDILSYFKEKTFKEFAELAIPQVSLFKNNGFRSFLKEHLRSESFSDLHIRLKVIATDIEKGISVVLDEGPLIPAIIASCTFPIVFPPIEINGVYLIDGGLFKNFPVSTIRNQCEQVIGVNVTPLTQQEYKNSLLYIAERSFHYMSVSNSFTDRAMCDILIESGEVSKYPMFGLDNISEIYQIGYNTAIDQLNKKCLKIK